jgi:hydroxyacylglutathione hydrolase
MIKVNCFTYNPFGVNCYIISNENKDCILIDPACYTKEDFDHLNAYLKNNALKPILLLNTHGHVDHIMGNQFIKENYVLNALLHQDDFFLVEQALDYAAIFGFKIMQPPLPQKLNINEIIDFGDDKIEFLHVPGHSPGSVVFHFVNSKILISGDVLFQQSIGRSDLPGGNMQLLVNGIREKLFVLADNTIVYPGHGDSTTIGFEKKNNPFIN